MLVSWGAVKPQHKWSATWEGVSVLVRGPLCLAEVSNHIQNLLHFQGNEAEGEKSKTNRKYLSSLKIMGTMST